MFNSHVSATREQTRFRAPAFRQPRWLSASALMAGALIASAFISTRATAQTDQPQSLNPVTVAPATPRGTATTAENKRQGAPKRPKRTVRQTPPRPQPVTNPAQPTPLNSGVVATSTNRLGLTVHETPASVEVVSRQQMQEQGYRTTTETAQGAVGVLSGDLGGAPATFSMRGFTGGAVNTLYNGIWIGPGGITPRVMETGNLEQVEFLKGPSSLMTGLNAIGGSVNYVSRQPTTGPIQNELDTSIDSLGTYRSHFGSGGGTNISGLDYRFDVTSSKIDSFIDGDHQQLGNVSGQLNYRVNYNFKVFAAIDYKRDEGHAYWGTPLTTTAFSGPFSTGGVVAGSMVNIFNGAFITGVTVDTRTTTTNYNIADNSTGAQELWLRSGFELAINDQMTVKDQAYVYTAQRHWFDSETYAFNPGENAIDRDRFFVTHDQQVIGNNLDFSWNTSFLGMENRFGTQLQVSQNKITFLEEGNFGLVFPFDTVSVVNPSPGTYGVMSPDIRFNTLDTVALSVEDRLKITPWLSLIGGVRVDDFSLSRSGSNFDGSIPAGQPFSNTWDPVSYRAAAVFEPLKGLMIYGMYATAFDPAVAGIFSLTPTTPLALTSARIYEAGAKVITDDKRAEATIAVYDIVRNNVYVSLTNAIATLAGDVHTQGIELSAAVRPVDNVKIWGNVALTDSKYSNFDVWTGNTPSNVAPVIVNAGASYRFDSWRWPTEIGASIRHVGTRYLFEDDQTIMLPYTTGDLFAFVDIPARDLPWRGFEKMRVMFRLRNVTNALYAQFSDPGLPNQVLLGAPRTFELSASAKW